MTNELADMITQRDHWLEIAREKDTEIERLQCELETMDTLRKAALELVRKEQESRAAEPNEDPIPHLNQLVPGCQCSGCVRLAQKSNSPHEYRGKSLTDDSCAICGEPELQCRPLRTNLQQSGE